MEIMELLQKAQKGDRQSRNQIVEENVGLVWSIVKRFAGRGYDQEDIFQIGCIGLIKAIDRFDVQFQVKFSTYAVPMITGEIKRFLRDDGMIKVSRTLKEQSYKVRRTAEKISQENGRNATLEEVAAATELSREEIVLALEEKYDYEHSSAHNSCTHNLLLLNSAESSFRLIIFLKCFNKFFPVKIRPINICEIKFCISKLPAQIIR